MSRRYRVIRSDVETAVEVAAEGAVTIDGRVFTVRPAGAGRYRVTDDQGVSTLVAAAGPPHDTWVSGSGHTFTVAVDDTPKRAGAGRSAASDMTAPMPATVVKVLVVVGDAVSAGAPVVVLEAMKMELTVRAARDGVVRTIGCAVGDLVTPGVRLVEIDG